MRPTALPRWHHGLRLGVLSACLGLSVAISSACGTGASSEASTTVEFNQELRLLVLPSARSQNFIHVEWDFIDENGEAVADLVTGEFQESYPQPFFRTMEDGRAEMFIPRGRYQVPAHWKGIRFSVSSAQYLKDGSWSDSQVRRVRVVDFLDPNNPHEIPIMYSEEN